jgi:prevent-host-death family protein
MTGQIMKTVSASNAKAQLLGLLDEVERGDTVVITRHGKPIARLVPDSDHRAENIRAVFAEIDELRKHTKPVTPEELLAWRDEGRK